MLLLQVKRSQCIISLTAETQEPCSHFTDEETEAEPELKPTSGPISEASLLTLYHSTVVLESSRAESPQCTTARSAFPSVALSKCA